MLLTDYIRETGVAEFAARFDITKRAATSYLQLRRLPKAALARRLVAETPVTWEGIYGLDPKPDSPKAENVDAT